MSARSWVFDPITEVGKYRKWQTNFAGGLSDIGCLRRRATVKKKKSDRFQRPHGARSGCLLKKIIQRYQESASSWGIRWGIRCGLRRTSSWSICIPIYSQWFRLKGLTFETTDPSVQPWIYWMGGAEKGVSYQRNTRGKYLDTLPVDLRLRDRFQRLEWQTYKECRFAGNEFDDWDVGGGSKGKVVTDAMGELIRAHPDGGR